MRRTVEPLSAVALLGSRSLHGDPLMRAPAPLLDDSGLIDPPKPSMGALAAGGRAPDDFPLSRASARDAASAFGDG